MIPSQRDSTVKLSPLQFVVNAEAGLFTELSNCCSCLPCILEIAGLENGRDGLCVLILIFKVFNYIVPSMDMILSLKCDYMFCPFPQSIIVRSKACLPLRLNFSLLITNVVEPIL